jgi:hypothetical protein
MFAAGIERQANKVRAYLHAAFALATKARTNPKLPAALKCFNIRSNPVSTTATNPEFNRAAKDPLSHAELATYWTLIRGLDGVMGIALRLHLLLGGQRIQQLVRLLSENVQEDRILLWDIKGPPDEDPRRIDLPLVGLARDLPRIHGSEWKVCTVVHWRRIPYLQYDAQRLGIGGRWRPHRQIHTEARSQRR